MERIKVLVVDDSRVSCAMLSNMMAKTNFEVCGMASNCADAVLKYESLRPMAVTMDMNLPDADGIECSRRIREIDPDARIVMISAMKDASLMERGREVGITSFLQKPVSPYELIDALSCIVSDDIKRNTSIRDLYIQSFSKVLRQSLFSLVGVHSEMSMERAEGSYLDNRRRGRGRHRGSGQYHRRALRVRHQRLEGRRYAHFAAGHHRRQEYPHREFQDFFLLYRSKDPFWESLYECRIRRGGITAWMQN